MRGKHLRPVFVVPEHGLIPAYAGKTSYYKSDVLGLGAHPRVCGENIYPSLKAYTARGSSPRMRGKLSTWVFVRLIHGLIPAYAGKTSGVTVDRDNAEAHPRVCGENALPTSANFEATGSSPRMRGKLVLGLGNAIKDRLIPAYAGKTLSTSPRISRPRAHPRVCGENTWPWSLRARSLGSSPRMRGKPDMELDAYTIAGLIPAYAGKTDDRLTGDQIPRAHPRVCGENALWAAQQKTPDGSSPRMRGKPLAIATGIPASGLIPAYAGKTGV